MEQSRLKIIRRNEAASRSGGQPLHDKNARLVADNFVMFRPPESVVVDLMEKCRFHIPSVAKTSEVLRVLNHNPDCMFAIANKTNFCAEQPVGEGFIAMLPLNRLGLQQLALGILDATSPDLRLISKPDERPAGIYLWGIFAPGAGVACMALYMEKMSSRQYAGVDMYLRPVTEQGGRLARELGFAPGVAIEGIEAPSNLWAIARKSPVPLYSTYVPGVGGKELGITIARTVDDLMCVFAILDSVDPGSPRGSLEEEHDGNNLSGIHLLAYVGDEPVGCLRLRFFADFAKFERLAIRKEYRKSAAATQLVRAGFQFCQKKGYRQVYGFVQERLVDFWSRAGFQVAEPDGNTVLSEVKYVKIIAELERDPDSLTLGADPYLLIRPEGRWHIPGNLERSAVRSATAASRAGEYEQATSGSMTANSF